jgi:hypothetical protein
MFAARGRQPAMLVCHATSGESFLRRLCSMRWDARERATIATHSQSKSASGSPGSTGLRWWFSGATPTLPPTAEPDLGNASVGISMCLFE